MTLDEWYWLYEFRKPVKVYGTGKGAMTAAEVAEIYRQTYGAPDDE